MDKKTLILAIGMVLLIALFSWVVIKDQTSDVPFIGVHQWSGKSHPVQTVDVLKGHEYDLRLLNGSRIRAYLKVESVPEAREQVVQLLNNSRKPRVVLLKRKDAGHWYVELIVQPQDVKLGGKVGGEVSITDWLRSNDLIYDD